MVLFLCIAVFASDMSLGGRSQLLTSGVLSQAVLTTATSAPFLQLKAAGKSNSWLLPGLLGTSSSPC